MSEIELCVSGMSCAVCASRVSKALLSLSGVKDAEVSLISNKALVVFDSTRVNKDEIIAAVKNAGYGASVLKNNTQNSSCDVKNTKLKLISGLLLTIILIFIASSVMFNIILFKSALYYFVIEALLCLLVMYLQKDFFIRAVKALKKGETSMDTLVSLGSFVSFAYSLSMGSFLKNDTLITEFVIAHPLYFESAAGILCFVALGRYLEKKCRFKTSSVISSLYSLNPEKVCIKKDGQEVLSSPDEVKPGSIVIIRAGERISVDGEVISGHGFVNESSLTGESAPEEAAAPAPEEMGGAPAPGAEGAAPEEGAGDPIMQIAQVAMQALQTQDCEAAMAVCQAFIQLVQQGEGGAPEQAAPEGEPVYRAGGKLVGHIKK